MTSSCLKTIDCKQGAVRAVRFNIDGNYCITCGSDKTLKLWNPETGILLKRYLGHLDDVLDVHASCDSGVDKIVFLWDVIKAQTLLRLRRHSGTITSVLFNESSTMIISGSHDSTVMCWDTRSKSNNPIQTLHEATDGITRIQITNHEIITSSLDGKIRNYDLRMGKLSEDFIGEAVTCISLTSDEKCILTSCSDNIIRLFDKDNGHLLGKYVGHDTGTFYIENCIGGCDSNVFSGCTTGVIWCWDLVTMNAVNKFVHTKGQTVNSLSYHPSKQRILSSCGSSIKYWTISSSDLLSLSSL